MIVETESWMAINTNEVAQLPFDTAVNTSNCYIVLKLLEVIGNSLVSGCNFFTMTTVWRKAIMLKKYNKDVVEFRSSL